MNKRSLEGSPSLRPLLPSLWANELTDHGAPICPIQETFPISIPISKGQLKQNVGMCCFDFRDRSVSSREDFESDP